HDMIRIPDRFLPKDKHNFYSLSMLPVLYFFLPGIPMVYQGQEIGMSDYAREHIEDYVDLATHNNYEGLLAKGMTKEQALYEINRTSRENARTPMQWDDGGYAGFSDVKPWFPLNPDFTKVNVEKQKRDLKSLLAFYQKVIALRKNCLYKKNWIYGGFTVLEAESDHLWCFMRCMDGQKLQVLVNISDECVSTKECYDGKVLLNNYDSVSQKAGCLCLQPYQAVVLFAEN
ncbi:MAG: glucohydrolase, partial [Lachnospiraceae bacterium]|nr:glucohydrolase [Lachnospiraceae bacterium]